jgi:hypothetical protein
LTRYLQECLRRAKFIWTDKAALVLGIFFSFLLLLFWSLAFFVIGELGTEHLWQNFGFLQIELGLLTIASVWFAMRTTDFLIGGSTYRLFDHRYALTM